MSFKKLLAYFLVWRTALLFFVYLGTFAVPLQINFLGGGINNYFKNPFFWSMINFDGEHFLSIAQNGYQPLTYFYFPLFPKLASILGRLLGGQFIDYAWSGIIISHVSFFAGLVGLAKLAQINYSRKVAEKTVILLLLFPTSFYFASYYSESLFFTLAVWTFYMAQKNSFFLSGVFGAFASATRVVGISIFPSILTEYIYTKLKSHKPELEIRKLLSICLIPVGLVIYMIYLKIETGDPINFFNSIELFGDQRSTAMVILPQVFYRYFFKILPALNYDYFPAVFFTFLELAVSTLLLVASATAFFKLKPSFSVYTFLSFIIPTLSGSFSSLPRYALTIFPVFILGAIYLVKLPRPFSLFVYSLMTILSVITVALFSRGFWIS